MQFLNNYLNRAKKFINILCGKVSIPERIQNSEEKKVLHISDTPDCIYPYIFKVIEKLKPDVIIHTGDLVDNIKLGNGSPITRYAGRLQELLIYLEKNSDKEIYVVPGNHDSAELLGKNIKHIKLIKEGSIVNISGIDFGLAHYPERLPLESKINLYGHNKVVYPKKDKLHLNGLLTINIILLPSLTISKLSYPLQTDNARKYKNLKLP